MILACGTSTEPLSDLGPVPDGPLRTDFTGYVARRLAGSAAPVLYRFTVITHFENRGVVPLYLGRCLPDSPQPQFGVGVADSAAAESAYDPVWACVGHDQQFEVLPGASRVDTLTLQGPNLSDGHTHEGIGVTEGQFRLLFDVRLTRGGGVAAPDSVRRSNAFIVRTAQ